MDRGRNIAGVKKEEIVYVAFRDVDGVAAALSYLSDNDISYEFTNDHLVLGISRETAQELRKQNYRFRTNRKIA